MNRGLFTTPGRMYQVADPHEHTFFSFWGAEPFAPAGFTQKTHG
jgi:hypothetical protein